MADDSSATSISPASKAQLVAERYTSLEVAQHLDISTETLHDWCGRFGALLSSDGAPAAEHELTFGQADIAILHTVHMLLEKGYDDVQISERLKPKRIHPSPVEPIQEAASEPHALAPAAHGGGEAGEVRRKALMAASSQSVGDMLGAIAGSQQAVLNSQSSMRDMVSVVVQDNFSLKDENRKLRERMLELERALAEYQRREETRKERVEARMRALEGTMAALQQQMAQFVQIQRAQQKKRGLW